MDIPADVLQAVKCKRCETYLSRGPVYLQRDGTAVCSSCFAPERSATRMIQYEALARLLRFPCKNHDLGCSVTVPFVEKDEVIDHEEVCEHRQYVCPVFGSTRCNWLGTRATIRQHCSSQHPGHVLQNPCTITHDITRSNTNTYLLNAFHVLFLLYTKVCLVSGRIYHSVRYLGSSEDATNFEYTLDIKRDKVCVSKNGDVAPQGCLAIQEPTSLAMNTNSLLDMLGGFDGTTFTITVKQRLRDAAIAVTCSSCKALLYQCGNYWRCEPCDLARRTCAFKNCKHTDANVKCVKHELYFCQQRTTCKICVDYASEGSLYMHYDSAHAAETYRAGSTWRIRSNVGSQCCLVSGISGVIGSALCWYRLGDSDFVLDLYTSISSELLSEFRCTVKISICGTGHTRTYTPDACYLDMDDWHIRLKRTEFSSWSKEFDVCVDVTRVRNG